MSVTDKVRVIINELDGKFSVREIQQADPYIEEHQLSGILARLESMGELVLDEMISVRFGRGCTRRRYYRKTALLKEPKNVEVKKYAKARKKPVDIPGFSINGQNFVPKMKGKGILGIRVHRALEEDVSS